MEIVFIGVIVVLFYGIMKSAVEVGTYDTLVKFDKFKQNHNNMVD